MRKFFYLLLLFSSTQIFSQAPQGINYQAVARDVSGNPLATQSITATFRIRQTIPTGTAVYRGTLNTITNQFGLFTAIIGQTGSDSGSFSAINWGADEFFLQVIVNGYDMGTTKFMSVPYALYSGTAWNIIGNAGTVDSTNFIGTTNNVPFNIRVNNQKAGRIDPTLFNTAFGYQALDASITGASNTAIGYGALFSNTTGANNTAIGLQSLNSNVAGSNATAIGTNAMYYANNTATTFTNRNVAVGFEALRGSTTASANTGNYNTALGYQTLLNNSSASQNIAIGVGALQLQGTFTNGGTTWNSNNVAVGHQALYSNQPTSTSNGINNTAIGILALYSNTTGLDNIAIGNLAGYTSISANANTTGNNNTFIGYNTGFASATQRSNATAIGYNAKVDADNAMVLGGTGADAVNVGIGTTSPVAKLEVAGNVKIADGTQGNGKVLTSDAAGLASWQTVSSIAGGVPEGTILPFGGISAPAGYLLCDGSQVSRTTYSPLFAVIGVAYGAGDGSTTFHLPDLRGRFCAWSRWYSRQ